MLKEMFRFNIVDFYNSKQKYLNKAVCLQSNKGGS